MESKMAASGFCSQESSRRQSGLTPNLTIINDSVKTDLGRYHIAILDKCGTFSVITIFQLTFPYMRIACYFVENMYLL